MRILQFGEVICTVNTHGRGGLHGFVTGSRYNYQMVECQNGEKYYQVRTREGKYQMCKPGAFKQYFKLPGFNDLKE